VGIKDGPKKEAFSNTGCQYLDIILKMQEINPKYITGKIVKKAFKRLGVVQGEVRTG